MKNLFLLLLSCFVAGSAFADDGFTIKGKLPVKDYDNRYIYLLKQDVAKLEPDIVIDSTLIRDGMFVFNGTVKNTDVYRISLRDEDVLQYDEFVIIEPGMIEVNYEPLSIRGTPLNDRYTTLVFDLYNQLVDQQAEKDSLSDKGLLTKQKEEEFDRNDELLKNKGLINRCQFIKENAGTPVGDHFYMVNRGFLKSEDIKELSELISDELKEKLAILDRRMDEHIAYLDSLRKNAETAIVEGKAYIDISSFTPEGDERSLSDYVGRNKVTMIDFWASWCGPCIKELPFFKSLYQEYRDRGFEIVGISLDIRKSEWITGISKHEIPWPQLSDIKHWLSPVIAAYNVKAIPYTILIDQGGIIIGKNLKGEELISAIEKALD